MESLLTDNVKELVKQLIFKISGFDESSEYYSTIEDFAFTHLTSPDYYFTYNKNDIAKTVSNLGEKFRFHGFFEQSEAIMRLTKKLFDSASTRDDEEVRVSIMKFLLSVSHSPTNKFIENPALYKPKEIQEEDIIDWGEYLKDTTVQIQSFSASSDEDWTDLSDCSSDSFKFESEIRLDEVDTAESHSHGEPIKTISRKSSRNEVKHAKEELIKSIQTGWWNKDNIVIEPTSKCDESRVALEWQSFINETTMGLVSQNASIVPEYRIMREIIWQFYETTSCFSFGFNEGVFSPRPDRTISSVRSHTFQYFLTEFMPYFEMMKAFRNFQKSLHGEYFVAFVPDSYRSYSEAINDIVDPVYEKIRDLENRIKNQDKPMTILTMASELKPLFKNLEYLYEVHMKITDNFNINNGYKNTTYLLSSLSYGLIDSSDVIEQNIYLTLYLKSLYKYFAVIEIWLSQDSLDDSAEEFIIFDKNSNCQEDQDWQIEYVVRELDYISRADGMLRIISTKILQLAKNIHFLRLLGKLHLITSEFESFKSTIHEEYVHKVIEEAINYTKNPIDTKEEEEEIAPKQINNEPSTICSEQNISKTKMDSLQKTLDLSDGFLATVFEKYLYQPNTQLDIFVEKRPKSLYRIINEKVTNMFPAKQILEKTFMAVLDSRYSVPGLMVKEMLINQFDIMKNFQLLKHLYLFEDDIIFPFYKNMFKQFELQQRWGNSYWLTSQLQDLLMDLYPEFHESCRVDVERNWRFCTNPITACELVTVHCRINWPISIIITPLHVVKYHEVFQFILKLKWAINTLNRLQFTVIEPKNKPFKTQLVIMKHRIRKLQSMRFFLLNDISSIQHYVLGHLFSGLWKKFDKDLEDSYDLESIKEAHDKFINRVHSFCVKLRDNMSDLYGFRKILSLVLQLAEMWSDIHNVDDEVLNLCEIEYKKCHKFLRPITDMEVISSN